MFYDELTYMSTMLQVRIKAARDSDDLGASAIEWAIISAIVAALALAIGAVIYNKVNTTAESIDTDFSPTK